MLFLSILTDRVPWPSVTVRVASHYRLCRRVAYLCAAFPCRIAMVCEVWKDLPVWTLSRLTVRLNQLTGRMHPCLVSSSPGCGVWLWQCWWFCLFDFLFPGTSHRFSSCCGKNITLKNNNSTATRVHGFSKGVVFSSDPLKYDEVFEVSVLALSFQCNKNCICGLVTIAVGGGVYTWCVSA